MPSQTARLDAQLLMWPHVAQSLCDTATGRCVLSQTIHFMTSVFVHIICGSGSRSAAALHACRLVGPSTPKIWEILSTLTLPFFENEFPIALLKSALCQWVWHQHCSNVWRGVWWRCRPLGGGPDRTGDSTIHNQDVGKEMALLVQRNWKRKRRGYCSHLKLVSCWYCTYQSYFIEYILCVHWHFSWFIIVIIRTHCVCEYTEREGASERGCILWFNAIWCLWWGWGV